MSAVNATISHRRNLSGALVTIMSSSTSGANKNNAPNTDAVSSADLEALLSPSVAAILASMNLGAAIELDVTLLSALPYIPSGNGATTFYPTTIVAAIQTVNPADGIAGRGPAAPNTSAGVNPSLIATALQPSGPDVMFNALSPLVTSGALPPTDKALVDYFYRAGKAAFVKLLLDEIVEQNGVAPGTVNGDTAMPNTTNPLNGGGALTINSLIDLIKSEIQGSLPWTDSSTGKQVTDLTQFMQIASTIVQATVLLAIPGADLRQFLLGQQEQSALTQLGLGPWLTLTFMLTFVTNPDSTFVDQIYARYAVMQAVRIAFTKLANAYDPTVSTFSAASGQITVLNTWVSGVLPKMLPTLSTADFQQTILDVTNGAAVANAMSVDLADRNKALGDRLSLAGNLEVNKEAQVNEVKRKRRAFYCWAVAYLAVLAASAFLISTDRLSAFFVLALATLGTMALVFFGGWIYRRLLRAGYVSP